MLLEQSLQADVIWTRYAEGRTLALRLPGADVAPNGGHVGVLTAGTSDIPVAEEAAALCHEMGCAVHSAYDVGVAGLHRLFEPLRAMLAAPADAIIVAAGMDGALPSVVAGLVDVPVIGPPTSVGYGLGGGGGLQGDGRSLRRDVPAVGRRHDRDHLCARGQGRVGRRRDR